MQYRVLKPCTYLSASLAPGRLIAQGDLPADAIAKLLKDGAVELVHEATDEQPGTVKLPPDGPTGTAK